MSPRDQVLALLVTVSAQLEGLRQGLGSWRRPGGELGSGCVQEGLGARQWWHLSR